MGERLTLRDYRTEERVSVTVSVGVVIAESIDSDLTMADLLREAEQTLQRAKQVGRNRVEKVDISSPSLSVQSAARVARAHTGRGPRTRRPWSAHGQRAGAHAPLRPERQSILDS